MMKRWTYILSLCCSIALWVIAAIYYVNCRSALRPDAMVSTIQRHVYREQQAIKSLTSNKRLFDHLWQNRISESEFRDLAGKEYIVQFFENRRLAFWNRNDFPSAEIRFFPRLTAVREANNVFLYQSFGRAGYPQRRLNILIPIFKHYDVSNEYLSSAFSASEHIPPTSEISLQEKPGFSVIRSQEGAPLFYVRIDAENIKPLEPDMKLILLILAALAFSSMTIQLLAIYLSRTRSVWTGIGFVFVVLVTVRTMVYFFGLPFDLGNLELFSPGIFASNRFLPSFGHMLLHVLCLYWLFSFVQSKAHRLERLPLSVRNSPLSWLVFAGAVTGVFILGFYLQHLVQSIVFDSDISFDTNTFNATNKFTLLALVIIALIARTYMMALQLCNILLEKSLRQRNIKYPAIILVCLALLFLHKVVFPREQQWPVTASVQNWLDLIAMVWSLTYIYFIDSRYFRNLFSHSGLFSLIFISVYFSVLFAVYFKFFIDEKEKNITRIAFAEKLSRQQDTDLELKFDEIESRVSEDTVLQNWLQYADSVSAMDLYNHFKLFNADVYFSRYTQDILLFDAQGRCLLHGGRMNLDSLAALRSRSIPTLSRSLFFMVDSAQQPAYLVYMPLKSGKDSSLLGYLSINFRLKKNITQSVYPRLLRDREEDDMRTGSRYNYAIYQNGRLANQYGSYNFDYYVPGNLKEAGTQYVQKEDVSELWYKTAPGSFYVVVYRNTIPIGILTIFSFLFGIFLVIASCENWAKVLADAWISGKKIKMVYNAGMSVRVKYFALGFTAVSFFTIGLSTVLFLTNRYQATSLDSIETNSANVSEFIQEYLQNQKSINVNQSLTDQLSNSEFAFLLTNIARQQKLDINVFDAYGKLAFTTQDNIYKENVLDDNMEASAFYFLKKKRLVSLIHPESIGKLDYTASYSPIINHENKLVGYLNIPSFYTNAHLNSQIISLITTLVNIYTILLLVSSIITFLFINSLTKSLRLVADSMKNVSLKNNELINWPYNDEIGLLVKEYNKMVAAVEQNARSLVLDERQNAWREMAQQVAHEIKNPLTPMKLNIQYLQQAINSNHPDIINLTKRVSSSIIEQIDNLNYIASEFSNFAKMPENKTERIELKSMLERIVLLFAGNKNLVISHSLPEEPVVVFADKSQMLRIFTNIVQNAVESIPTDEREGHVDIQLTTADNNTVLIKVKDNGSGIPDDVKDKIFDPYFTTKSSGTGLGLAMTKKIIELWGGSIRFESDHNGTTFFLTVPIG